jgi:DNA-binding TFAR19-related protein (PDSD5 family)
MKEEKSLEELREQKRNSQQEADKNPDAQTEAAENRKKQIWNQAKQSMTSEAASRLGNIKAANPQKAMKIAQQIPRISAQTGRDITDEELKELLKQLDNQNKSSGNIKYRR